jgi:WD40 repeat protein
MKKISVWLFITALLASCASQDSTGKRGLAVEDLTETGADIAVFPTDVAVFLQTSHINRVKAAFSPDGKLLVTGSETIKLWDVANGREIRTFLGHSDQVYTVMFSPDGRRIVSASDDETIKVWDAETGKEIHTFSGHSGSVIDGRRIISASEDETMEVWDVETGKKIRAFSYSYYDEYGDEFFSEYYESATFSPDGKQIAAVTDEKDIVLWDAASGRVIRTFSGYFRSVVAFSPDGKQIVSADDKNIVILLDITTGKEIKNFPGHSDFVMSVRFSPDGKQIVSGSWGDKTIKIWDVNSGKELHSFSSGEYVDSVEFSPDGKLIVSGGGNGTVELWDTSQGQKIRSFTGNAAFIQSAVFSPDKKLIASAEEDNTVKIWDAENGRLLHILRGHSEFVWSVTFSPDGKKVASGSYDNTVKLWDVSNGQEIRTFSGHSDGVSSVLFNPDGKQIVSGSYKSIKLWDAETGREIRSFDQSNKVNSLAFSPDGKQLISGYHDYATDVLEVDYRINLWDVASGRVLRSFKGGFQVNVNTVAFSPNGNQIISGSYNDIKLWDVTSGREIYTFSGHSDMVTSVAFSPNGKQIVSGGRDYKVKVWDITSKREICTLLHQYNVSSVAFSSDGEQILSSALDGTIRFWDISTGNEIAQFISFTGSDTQIVSATRGLTVETEAAATSIDGEWLTITPDGYYNASPQGDRYLNVRVGNTVSGIDAYRSVFYNPDVVQARLRGLPDPASKSSGTIQQAAAFLPPTVTILSPVTNTTTASASTTLSVAIADQNQPIQNIKIMVNGRLLGQQELSVVTGTGLQPQKASYTVTGNQKAVDFQLPLNLDPGPNRIEVVAFNGFSESRRYTDLTWNAPAGQRPALPNLWILAIGVNSYADNNIRNLNYCVADAKSVVDSLKAQEGKRYGRVNSLLIADGEGISPTAANIRQNLSFLEGAGPRDVVLLFLAGHGISENAGAFFFLPGDARLNANSTVNPATAIAGADLFSVLDAPGNRLVFIDACQSGGVDNDRLVRYLMDTNAFVFASSRGNELSQERPEFGHGVFTYSILNAIKGATAARAEGNVSVLSLSGFVSTDVPKITDDRQHPSAYSLGFYDFPLAVAP